MDLARPLAQPGLAGGLGYPASVATCLVTGGAGFLGSHLCDELLARGNRVICVDNLETGSLANIEHIRDPERFLHLGLDIIDPYFVEEPVDFVYHLASPASPIDYLRLPLHTLKVGSYGTHHTLGLAKKHRGRFLLASTSEVYGDPQVHPQPETYWGHVNPIGPRGVFDALPTDDPQVRQPDISLARAILGWEPTVDLREGLRRTIEQAGDEALVGAAR